MFKSDSSKFILITIIATIALLVALPKVEIKYFTKYFNIDTFIGGYVFNLPIINKVLDLSDYKKGLTYCRNSWSKKLRISY